MTLTYLGYLAIGFLIGFFVGYTMQPTQDKFE